MFTVGERVMYGPSGACRVTDIRRETFGEVEREYYVLVPLAGGSSIFVPTDSEQLTARMRTLLTPDEAKQLLRDLPGLECPWIEDNRERSASFQKTLNEGNARDLLALARAVYLRRQTLRAAGKKNLTADENAFKRAERILVEELSLVLEQPKDEVLTLLQV